ncbi:alpha/beta hydrolase [Amphritea sp. HPY]|uniref:alpha/beta hydrolase n=1 Tax=Amphritea sp. HPY TaxID=3421652 RepID=UPI003D7EEFA1
MLKREQIKKTLEAGMALDFEYTHLTADEKAVQLKRDADYNNRWAVPDNEEHLARWAEMSAEVRKSLKCTLDIPYGDTPRQKLDIFYPENKNPPLIIFLHGGYWMSMTKDSYSFIGENFVREGIAFACVDFELCPDVTVEEIIRQSKKAIGYLWDNSEALGFDSQRIYLCGHSSGGHLAAMMLAGSQEDLDVVPSNIFQGAMIVSGIFDMEPIRHTYINQNINMGEESARKTSPTQQLPNERTQVPHMIFGTGELELPEYHYHQAEYIKALKGQGQSLEVIDPDGYHHFDVPYDLAKPDGELYQAFLKLINQ